MARSRAKRGGRRSGRNNETFGKNWRTDGFTSPVATMVGRDKLGVPIMVNNPRGENRRWRRLGASIRAALEQAVLAQKRIHHRLEMDEMTLALSDIAHLTPQAIAAAAKTSTLHSFLKEFRDIVDHLLSPADVEAQAA